jgi:anti-sigma factor ChrR (cupin superfamily)
MSRTFGDNGCSHREQLFLLALRALPPHELGAETAHIAACPACREEFEQLRPVIDTFVAWPTDVLRPPTALWERLAERIGADAREHEQSASPAPPVWLQPEWEEVAPGISCKLLSTDAEQERVSMLVRLAPGVAYPPHRHAGTEELHLLEGELYIEDRKLLPGDYNFGGVGATDTIVRTETGCTCVLITSTRDVLQ